MSNAAPPAWYPDPDGRPGLQRYWDGVRWTEHYHPPLAPSAPPRERQPGRAGRPRRRRRVIALVAAGLAAALVVAAVVVVPRLLASPFDTVHTDVSASYDFTDPVLEIDPDHRFEFAVEYDLQAMADELAAEAEPGGRLPTVSAFEVFSDPGLTLSVPISVRQAGPGRPVQVSSLEHGTANGLGMSPLPIKSGDIDTWGLHDEYYLVRRLDASGETLAKPLVTRFTTRSELPAPDVSFSTPAADGNLVLSWRPVPGASEYLVIVSHDIEDLGGRSYDIVGAVSGTEWSSETTAFESDVAPFALSQNDGIVAFWGNSADEVAHGDPGQGYVSAYDIGVIATDGERFSPYASHDLRALAGALPYENALYASRELEIRGPSGLVEAVHDLPRTFIFTSLDGATRSTTAYIDPDEVREQENHWTVALRGRGTMLGDWIGILKSAVPDIRAAVEEFNALAAADAPATGMPTFTTLAAPVEEDAPGVAEVPETDYPVYGSTELTRFIARHMIAQTPVVDVSAFTDAPGAPDVRDAAEEAIHQNPYAIDIGGVSVSADGNRLFIGYRTPLEEADAIRADIRAAVDGALAAVVRDGMSDAEKVTALNDWLTGVTEYDDEAFDLSFGLGIPDGYEYAWNASGTLVEGRGVCASYAYAFNALANAAGVPTVVVTGDVLAVGAHAWNKVQVDGVWRAVDPTWNDSPAGNLYLMIPDAGFTDQANRVETLEWMIDWSIPEYAAR